MLPALFGMAMTFLQEETPAERVVYRRTTASFSGGAPGSNSSDYMDEYVRCERTEFYYPCHLCLPCDKSGRFLYDPAVSAVVAGANPDTLTPSSSDYVTRAAANGWPIILRGNTDNFCLTSHLFMNMSNDDGSRLVLDEPPLLGVVQFNADEAVTVLALLSNGSRSAWDPVVLTSIDSLPAPITLPYNSVVRSSFRASEYIDVHGRSEWTYQYALRSSYRAGRDKRTKVLRGLIYSNATTQTEREQLIQLYAQSDLNTSYSSTASSSPSSSLHPLSYFVSMVCVVPQQFKVEVVREVTTYGLNSFVSDVGGFLNLLALAVSLLFPLAYSAITPRRFILLNIRDKWIKRRKANDEPKQAQCKSQQLSGTDSRRHEMREWRANGDE